MPRRLHAMLSRDRDDLADDLRARAYVARVPLSVAMEVTYGCNLRCLHCLNPTHLARGELATREVCAILDGLAELGTLYLSVTGGEPLTRPDLPEILAHARRLGLHVTLLTNATRVDAPALERLTAASPDRVNVSLYGASAEVYDLVTGRPGAFDAFLHGFARLRDTGIPLQLTSVVLRENVHQMADMQRLSHELGAQFRFTTDVHPRQDGRRDPLTHRLPPAQVLDLLRRFAGLAEGGCADPVTLSGPFYCACGRGSAAITPHGRMNFCISVPLPQADATGGRVREAWEAVVRVRDGYDHAGSECAACELLPHCTRAAPDSLLEAGDLGKCVPYYLELARLRRGTT